MSTISLREFTLGKCTYPSAPACGWLGSWMRRPTSPLSTTPATCTPPSGVPGWRSSDGKLCGSPARSTTTLRLYGPPFAVTVVSLFARFSAMTSMRLRWAERPDALMSRERNKSIACVSLHAARDGLLQRVHLPGQDQHQRRMLARPTRL